MKRATAAAAALIVAATAGSAHADLEPRVLVIPVKGKAPAALGALVGDVEAALSSGASRTTPNVARATASLEDTAAIVGCQPTAPPCLDAIAAALNVDQLLIADVSTAGADAQVDVTAVTRETEPVVQRFAIHARTRADDLKALEQAVPAMLEAGEERKAEVAHRAGTAPPAQMPSTGHRVDRTPYLVMGGGALTMAAGGVCWLLASSKQTQIDEAPTTTSADLERLVALEGEAQRRATAGNLLVIGGAVIAAAGAAWWYLERHHRGEVAIAPAPTAGGAALTVGGVW